jgi:hypothetical protein
MNYGSGFWSRALTCCTRRLSLRPIVSDISPLTQDERPLRTFVSMRRQHIVKGLQKSLHLHRMPS